MRSIPKNELLLRGFITWLEGRRPRAGYSYLESETCAVAQYLKDSGKTELDDYCFGPLELERMGLNDIVMERPWTYGSALKRARKELKKYEKENR